MKNSIDSKTSDSSAKAVSEVKILPCCSAKSIVFPHAFWFGTIAYPRGGRFPFREALPTIRHGRCDRASVDCHDDVSINNSTTSSRTSMSFGLSQPMTLSGRCLWWGKVGKSGKWGVLS